MAKEQKNAGEVLGEIKKRIKVATTETKVPKAKVLPQIWCGHCSACGVHYSQCEHYKDIAEQLRCSYCGRQDIIKDRIMYVYLLEETNTIVAVCDDYSCQKAHQDKYTRP